MAKATWINVGRTWTEVTNIWRNVGGTWQEHVMSWYNAASVWKECMLYNLIQVDTYAIDEPEGFALNYTDYCAINVTPDSMGVTITKIDTGDGTAFFGNPLPATGTGDFSFRFRATSDNTTGFARSLTARITDNAAVAATVDVTVTQQTQPG